MTKTEWQLKYDITDEEMGLIEFILHIYRGKIVSVERKEIA